MPGALSGVASGVNFRYDTGMRYQSVLCASVLSALAAACAPGASASEVMGATEARDGLGQLLDQRGDWIVLFDGTSTDQWRGYKKETFPAKGWVIEDGALKVQAGGGGGDIITREQFADFELELEFKVAKAANSGIMYRVTEEFNWPWMTGPEYQILEDGGHTDGKNRITSVGSIYALYEPSADKVVKPIGDWNSVKIRLVGGVLEHHLNGAMVASCRIDTPEWKEKIKQSKFRDMPGFGIQPRGHIALQDHGDDVWFRNIRARHVHADATGAEGKEAQSLFNGRDLSGWNAFLNDGAAMDEVWRVEDGVLICKGTPAGYIMTSERYADFVLSLEWRWNPETQQGGNSGVLFRVNGPDKVWPRSVEAQLHSGNAGDFWNIGDMAMKTDPARTNGRNTKKMAGAENPVGEWNHYEITCIGDRVTLKINGTLVNEAWDVERVAGPIALQSEGTEIHFRKISVAETRGE